MYSFEFFKKSAFILCCFSTSLAYASGCPIIEHRENNLEVFDFLPKSSLIKADPMRLPGEILCRLGIEDEAINIAPYFSSNTEEHEYLFNYIFDEYYSSWDLEEAKPLIHKEILALYWANDKSCLKKWLSK